MLVIGLGNRARHGKDTAATAILEHAARSLRPVYKMSWAESLREEVNLWLNANPTWQFGNSGIKMLADGTPLPEWVQPSIGVVTSDENPYGKHSLLLQWWGTDYRRHQDTDYWIRKGEHKLNAFFQKYPNGVATAPDTRFINEVEAIERRNGITIQVTRLNPDGSLFRDPSRDPNHPSEVVLDNWNWQHKIVSKSPVLTGELAITIFEYERSLRGL
jgi:hypothetical protein